MDFLKIAHNPFTSEVHDAWKDAADYAEDAAHEAGLAAVDVLMETVRDRAPRFGWRDEMIEAIEMNEAYGLGIPAESPQADEVLRREFGTEHLRPAPLLRTSMRRSREEAEQVFEDTLRAGLFGEDA